MAHVENHKSQDNRSYWVAKTEVDSQTKNGEVAYGSAGTREGEVVHL